MPAAAPAIAAFLAPLESRPDFRLALEARLREYLAAGLPDDPRPFVGHVIRVDAAAGDAAGDTARDTARDLHEALRLRRIRTMLGAP